MKQIGLVFCNAIQNMSSTRRPMAKNIKRVNDGLMYSILLCWYCLVFVVGLLIYRLNAGAATQMHRNGVCRKHQELRTILPQRYLKPKTDS